jgi:hypothetical protein
VGDGTILPAERQGTCYKMAVPGLPPQYVSALLAAAVWEYSDARSEYSKDMRLQYKREYFFLLYKDMTDQPDEYTPAEKVSHTSVRYPKNFAPFFIETQSAQ